MLRMLESPSLTTSWACAPLYCTTPTWESFKPNCTRWGKREIYYRNTQPFFHIFFELIFWSVHQHTTENVPLKQPYFDLLISDQSVDHSYDEVLSNSKVASADTLRAVHDKGNVQGSTLALWTNRNRIKLLSTRNSDPNQIALRPFPCLQTLKRKIKNKSTYHNKLKRKKKNSEN